VPHAQHTSSSLICLMIFEDEHKLWSPSLCNFLYSSVGSSVSGPDILLRTLPSYILVIKAVMLSHTWS
jgi:hypothetical protein